MYHSKSLMFRLGNKEKLPLEFEFGLFMATQFGGDQYKSWPTELRSRPLTCPTA